MQKIAKWKINFPTRREIPWFQFFCFFLCTNNQYALKYYISLFNPIQGGEAKTPVLHFLAISQSFQVGLEWCQKQMWNPHNEAPCRKKNQKFGKLGSTCNFYSPYKNSETSKKNRERAFFRHFWIETKKSYFI